MIYSCGTIHIRKGIVFKDGSYDTRIHGHPTVITFETDYDTEHIYFLTMSSNTSLYTGEKDRDYFLLKPDARNRIRKPSLINLKFIYKTQNSFIKDIGCLDRPVFTDMLRKFDHYQSTYPDEYYGMLQPLISRYL